MLWLKAFHIIFMVTWFAGLFYLPRLFVYHARSTDDISIARFKIMERKLLWGITTPGAILTIVAGLWMLHFNAAFISTLWFQIKMIIVLLTLGYHAWCIKLVIDFREDRNTRSHTWYRWFNEIPVIFLVVIVLLVEVQPF